MDVLRHWIAYRDRWQDAPKVITPRDDDDVAEWRRLGYRVEGPFVLEDAGAVEALSKAYTALCADDLGPNVTVEAVEEARRVLAVAIAQPRGGQSSPAGCPACSRVPGVARPPHTCSGEQS